jgi:hypothetical protein
MVNVNAKVFYAQTSDWSKIAVGDGAGCETVDFALVFLATKAVISANRAVSGFALVHFAARH